MAAAQSRFGSLTSLSFAITLAIFACGCCGPMACGPMGCGTGAQGPLMGAGCASGSCGGCNGCGETYIDEWINHPPSCDNCDSCGNHNGQTCGSCRPIFDGFKSLWGYRRDCGCDSGCSTGSCDSGCGGGCDSGCGGCSSCGGGEQFASDSHYSSMESGHHYVDSSQAIPMPHRPSQAPQIVEAKPAVKPFQPQRTKQIFRPKNSVAGNSSSGNAY